MPKKNHPTQQDAGPRAAKIKTSSRADGPRKLRFSAVPEPGAVDAAYYYNLIDYNGDMRDYVNVTRHQTLAEAVKEAERLASDRKWAGPGTNDFYAGVPPRVVRTFRMAEVHRVEVEGPLPQSAFQKADELWKIEERAYEEKISQLVKAGKDPAPMTLEFQKRRMDHFAGLEEQFEWAPTPNAGQPHPPLG